MSRQTSHAYKFPPCPPSFPPPPVPLVTSMRWNQAAINSPRNCVITSVPSRLYLPSHQGCDRVVAHFIHYALLAP